MQSKVYNEKEKEGMRSGWRYYIGRLFYGKTYKEKLLFLSESVLAGIIAYGLYFIYIPYIDSNAGAVLFDAFICSVGKSAIGGFAGGFYALYKSSAQISEYIPYLLIIVLRTALSISMSAEDRKKPPFCEGVAYKVATCGILCFTHAGMFLAENGISHAVLPSVIAILTLAPSAALIFSVFFEGCPVERIGQSGYDLSRAFYEICTYAFFAVIVYCFKDVYYAGVCVGMVMTVFLTMVTAERGGFLRGTVVGAILGLICSYSAQIALMGFVCALLFPLGSMIACGVSTVSAVALSVYIEGSSTLLTFAPEAVVAFAFASPIIRYSFIPERFPFPKDAQSDPFDVVACATAEGIRKAEEFRAMKELSLGLKRVSAEIDAYDSTLALEGELCEKVKNELCESCPLSPICWEHERYRTEKEVAALYHSGIGSEDDRLAKTAPYLSTHCIRLGELKNVIRAIFASESIGCKRLIGNDYGTVSEILSDFADQSRAEMRRDTEKEKEITGRMRDMGYASFEVTVYGEVRRRVTVFGPDLSASAVGCDKIKKLVCEICQRDFCAPVFSGGQIPCTVFYESEQYKAECAVSKICKEGEEVSGDSVTSFSDGNGRFYALLSDGMGSGRQASDCSSTVSALFSGLVLLSIRKSLALSLLDELVRARFNECFSTIDLCELDLVRGSALFVKSGAAASYVLRNGVAYCINSKTMPVGIGDDHGHSEMPFQISDGDAIIMVSDGIAEDRADGAWIETLLESGKYCGAQEISDAILDRAVKEKGRIDDDMTVMVTQISAVA